MRAESVSGYLELSGLKIDKQTLIYWEKEGILGEVIRIGKDRRDYSPLNINKIVLTIILRNAGWSLGDIKNAFGGVLPFPENANTTLDRITTGLLPALNNARRIL